MNNKFTKNKIVLIAGMIIPVVLLSIYLQPHLSHARGSGEEGNNSNNNTTITIDNPLGDKVNNLPSFIYMILDIVFQIGAVFAVLAIIYVGFMFVSARGDPEKLQTARRAFLWTVIGIALLLGGRLVASVIGGTVSQVSTGIY